MTAVSYHGTVNDLQGLWWLAGGPFARPEWFALLEQSGATPMIALARDGNSAVAWPLIATRNGLVSLSNWYAFTWAGLKTGEDANLERELAAQIARKTGRIMMDKLPDEDGTASRIEAALRAAGWRVLRERCDVNHVLGVSGRSFAQYLADRPGALRTTLKRKASKVTIEIVDTFEAHAWDAYETVYANSWKTAEGDPALLSRFAEAEGAAGRLRLGLAHHDGTVVAAQFWTVENGTAWIHKLAHLEDAQRLSAGTTLTAALFEHVIDRDQVSLVDFGTGDDPYKRDWMDRIRPRYRLTAWRAGQPGNWPELAKVLIRQLVSRRHRE